MAETAQLSKKQLKLLKSTAKIANSGELLPTGGINFWVKEGGVQQAVVQINLQGAYNTLNLYTGTKELGASLSIDYKLGELVNGIDDSCDKKYIIANFQYRKVNPALTLEYVEKVEATLNAQDKAKGEEPNLNRFNRIKQAIANRDSDNPELQQKDKNVYFLGFEDNDDIEGNVFDV